MKNNFTKELKVKNRDDYDFIKFKNNLLKNNNIESIDVVFEYVKSKLNTRITQSIIQKILFMDKSLEQYDIAIDISLSLRNNFEKNKNYIPTWQHILRCLYNIGNKYNNQKSNSDGVLDINEYVEYIEENDGISKIEEYYDLYNFMKKQLNESDYEFIIRHYIKKYTVTELAEYYNVSKPAISKRIKKIISILQDKRLLL